MKCMTRKVAGAVLFLVLFLAVSAAPVLAAVTISKGSATIQTGKSITLTVKKNGKAVSGAVWGSSDPEVASVKNGKVTGVAKGSAVISAVYDGTMLECIVSVIKNSTSTTARYNVLIMDCSGSMKGTPLKRAKKAAIRFSNAILKADGKNYVALISLGSSSKVVCGFTSSKSKIKKAINSLQAKGNTNMISAMKKAAKLMKSVPGGSKTVKNVILCSDGIPKKGSKTTSGRYKKSDHKYYAYANAVYKQDAKMKKAETFIYALGFFHNAKGKNLSFGKKLMKDLASKDKYHEIDKPEDIEEAFDEIVETITSVTLSNDSLSMFTGDTAKLTAYKNGNAAKASWSSSDPSVASVSNAGKVTAKGKGNCYITAIVGDQSATCEITVQEKASIKLNKKTATVSVSKTIELVATVTGKSSSVTWKSDNPAVAEVSDGTVRGIKAGTALITATANGLSASCRVTVTSLFPEQTAAYNGHHYRVYNIALTWKNAKAYCEKQGGHLVTITSAGEDEFTNALIMDKSAEGTHHYWLGGTDEGSEGTWRWVTGETWSYANWDYDQPNNHSGNKTKRQDFLEKFYYPSRKGSDNFKWNDEPDDGYSEYSPKSPDYYSLPYYGFICEWDH